ncbi:unnamed protein product [Prunus armeniaca]
MLRISAGHTTIAQARLKSARAPGFVQIPPLCLSSTSCDCSSARGVTSRDRLRRSMVLSALGPHLCPHGFVSGSSRAISQWVTHLGIALASTRLISEFS